MVKRHLAWVSFGSQMLKRHLARFSPLLLLLHSSFVLVVSLAPAQTGGQGDGFGIPHFDKLAHAGMYLVMAALAWLYLRSHRGFPNPEACVLSFGLAFAFGAAMEAAQLLVPGRSFSLLDAAANSVGALTGIALAPMLLGVRKGREAT